MKTTCKDVRDQINAEALCCLAPIEQGELGFKVSKLVTFRGTEIHMDFLEREDDMRLYYNPSKDIYYLYKGRQRIWDDSCPPTEYTIMKSVSQNTQLMLLYSLFSNMLRAMRYADAASDAAFDAAFDAALAAAAAKGAFSAACGVRAAFSATADAADADDAAAFDAALAALADADDAAKGAFSAARGVRAAFSATADAAAARAFASVAFAIHNACDAADTSAAYRYAKKAFKYLINYRKLKTKIT